MDVWEVLDDKLWVEWGWRYFVLVVPGESG